MREAFSFHSLLVGGNPFATSSIYTLIHALERRWGVWFPRGGTGALIRGLVRRFEELGGKVRLNAPVARVETANGRAVGVTTADGWNGRFDAVASNADIVHTYAELLRDNPRGGQMTARLRRKRFSMSLFVVYFGLRRHRPEIHHHTVLFGPRYRGLIDDIFNRETLAEDFSLYLHAPCATDPSLAPPGAGSFYVLAPVPHLGKAPIDWEADGPDRAGHVILGDPAQEGALDAVDRQPGDQERDERADAQVDDHPATIAREPQRERHEHDGQDDHGDDDDVERLDGAPGGEEAVRLDQLDRPEVRRQGHPERSLEPLGEHVRRVRAGEVGQRDVGRDDAAGLQLRQRGPDDREDLDGDVAVDDGHVVGLVTEEVDDPGMGHRQRPLQRGLDAGIQERHLEALLDGAPDGQRQRAGQRLDGIGQARLEPGLDVERGDDLVADPRAERVDDGRLGQDLAGEIR